MKSEELRCIYIHIPKTAGTSISRLLGADDTGRIRGSQDHRSVRNIQASFIPKGFEVMNPIRWMKYVNQNYQANVRHFDTINRQEFLDYFKFAIVRNPWDRVYSWYRNVSRDPLHLKEHGIDTMPDFEDFIKNHSDSWALRSQLDWIIDAEGNIAVDYIGKFENLNKEIEYISNKCGITSQISHELDSGFNQDYRAHYNEQARDFVAKRYKNEIDIWGYEF